MQQRVHSSSSYIRILLQVPVAVEQWVGVAAFEAAGEQIMLQRIHVAVREAGNLPQVERRVKEPGLSDSSVGRAARERA
jgi:2,3-bisphosphoglycerate-independent phosphoglycerate mutase